MYQIQVIMSDFIGKIDTFWTINTLRTTPTPWLLKRRQLQALVLVSINSPKEGLRRKGGLKVTDINPIPD